MITSIIAVALAVIAVNSNFKLQQQLDETRISQSSQDFSAYRVNEVELKLKESRSRELAAVALLQMNKDLERGLLIALEAAQTAPTFEAQDALRQLLHTSNVKHALSGQEQTEDLITLARSHITRVLTCEERLQYLHEEACATPMPVATTAP